MFKKHAFILLLILLLAACAPTLPPAPENTSVPPTTEIVSVSPATEAPAQVTSQAPLVTQAADCPTAAADSKLLESAEDGFCLLYPAEFTWDGARLIVLNPTGLAGDAPGDAWLLVSISGAVGQTAAQIADAQIAEMGQGFEVARTELTVDGKQAILVDGLPAQDSVRYLYVVNNDRLYRFEFMPWFPTDGTGSLEKLYQTVVDTLHFLP